MEVYKACKVILEFYIMYFVCNNNMLYNNLCNQVYLSFQRLYTDVLNIDTMSQLYNQLNITNFGYVAGYIT